MQTLYDKLKKPFDLGEFTAQKPGLAFVTVTRAQLRPLLLQLRDVEGFTHLVLLTAVGVVAWRALYALVLARSALAAAASSRAARACRSETARRSPPRSPRATRPSAC